MQPAVAPDRRHFLGWTTPALPAAAAVLADAYAAPGVLGMERALVVLPGRRALRRLQELLLAEAERRDMRLVPPRLITAGELPELLYLPELPPSSPVAARWAWARALRSLPPERLGRLLRTPPGAADLLGWLRLARSVDALHRTVSGAGKRFAGVIDCCDEQMLFRDHARWEVLAEAQQRWSAELRALGMRDPGEARLDALERGAVGYAGDLWLLGVAELPAITRRLLLALPASVPLTALVHAPAEESALFDELGCVRPEAWAERELPLRDEQIAVVDAPREQALAAARALGALDGRYAADEVVISVSDPELIPYLEQTLSGAGVPVRSVQGLPLERVGVLRLLVALADYLDGRRYEAFAALVRHPQLSWWLHLRARIRDANGVERALGPDWLARLDDWFGKHLPATTDSIRTATEQPSPTVEALLAALEGRDATVSDGPAAASPLGRLRAGASRGLLAALGGTRPLRDWLAPLLQVVTEVYEVSRLDRASAVGRPTVEALEQLRDAALALRELPAALDEPCDAATAVRLLVDDLREREVRPEAERSAVELLGWLEIHLDDTPVAVLTGVNEPFLPESRNADAFLPNTLRTRLGIPDNAARYARDAYQLEAVLRSRAAVTLVAGRRSVLGDPLRPSRLLFALRGRRLAERVRAFYADDGDARAAVAALHALPPARRSRFQLPPEPVISAPRPLESLRVTDFRSVLGNPYLFALQRVRELEALDDDEREMSPLVFGSFAHVVLERFGRSPEAQATDAVVIRAALDRELEHHAARSFGSHPLPAVRIQVEQLRARLAAFALWQAQWAAAGWRIVASECGTPPAGAPFPVDGIPFHLRGRIDRIDHHAASGAWAVFDYKTGEQQDEPDNTHRRGRGDDRPWCDLQLPLYRHLLEHVVDAGGARIFSQPPRGELRLGYIRLPRELELVGGCFAEWSADDLASADEAAREVVRLVRRNRFAFDPARLTEFARTDFAALVGVGNLASALDDGGRE